jgi:hypothetical protein
VKPAVWAVTRDLIAGLEGNIENIKSLHGNNYAIRAHNQQISTKFDMFARISEIKN